MCNAKWTLYKDHTCECIRPQGHTDHECKCGVIATLEQQVNFESLIKLLDEHDSKHGINCSCMDEHIRVIRRVTECQTANGQLRMDYLLQAASKWRPLRIREIK